jgi:hypothetical protein
MHAIDELLQTERDYVYDLNHLTKVSVQKKKKKKRHIFSPLFIPPFLYPLCFQPCSPPPFATLRKLVLSIKTIELGLFTYTKSSAMDYSRA